MFVTKVFLLQYVVKTVLYGPKKATCKNEVFLVFCFFVLSPMSFVLVVIETTTWCLSPCMGLYFKKINQCGHKISRWRFNSCFTWGGQICDEISWRGGNFVTHTNKFFLGPRWFLMGKSLNSHLGSEFRQPLKKTKYEVTLKIFWGKNYFVLKVWRN